MLHEYRDEIAHLKASDSHFAKIFEEHNELDQKIKIWSMALKLPQEKRLES